ncbi:MAG: hypothetical protein ABFD16_19595, partial [Thermoguttaceae bacterium]
SAGETAASSGRAWQSKRPQPALVPDRIELRAADGPLVQLSELVCGKGGALENVFCDHHSFFLAFNDGEPCDDGRRWRWFSAVLTPGSGAVSPIGKSPEVVRNDVKDGLLADPGFEESLATRLESLRTGNLLPGGQTRLAWQMPQGGRIVAQPVHGGAAAAEVENTSGQYLLWRQPLSVSELPAGSRWRVTAWVKGEGIKKGDVGWKVGVVRLAVHTDRTNYVSCPELVGTFDWKQVAVEFTVPEKLGSLSVEAGLNGATGKMWIDDVRLERRE